MEQILPAACFHFSRLGRPVVADRQHGDFAFNKRFNRRYHLRRQFLHAATIAFEYKGKKRKWTAPLPEDLARVLKALQAELPQMGRLHRPTGV